MFLAENTTILQEKFPNTWQRLKELKPKMNTELLFLEETKSGEPTVSVTREGKTVYLHSKYNPMREAQAIVDQYQEVEDDINLIFYGIGLGYQVEAFLKKHPNANYYLYEPIPELFYTFLNNKSLKKLPGKNLKDVVIGDNERDTQGLFNGLIDKNRKKLLLVELPTHKEVFPEEYQKFLDLFQKTLKSKRTNLHTNYAFQKRWIVNCVKNFKEVLSTPNIVMAGKGRFQSMPALLVAAGPSLNEEIENIRYIKDNGLAYIFSVGSAINTLIHYRVYPHAACTYDPSARNQIVFEKLKAEGIKEIPLIFGSSTGYETLDNYPGEMCHMITSQDTVANYFLKTTEEERLEIVSDAPTIALVTLQLLHTLGFNPIILVGQNLAYRGKERHAAGVDYSSAVTDKQKEKGFWVKDVYGHDILTNEGFNIMRRQMELYIKNFIDCKVINTTKDGAQIEGSVFLELDKVINRYLEESVYDEGWLRDLTTVYDPEHLNLQWERIDRSYQRALRLTEEYADIVNKIEKLINNRNYREAEKMYVKLDKVLGKIERNKFFTIFLLPMNRVQYKILADSIDSLNEERNPARKGQRIVEGFKHFIALCQSDLQLITPFYEELKEEILADKG